MDLEEKYRVFIESLKAEHPESSWPEALKSLWHDGSGDWESAHNIAQDIPGPTGSWIHAYLHRKEGDRFNAQYWYGRAGRPFPSDSLEEEFQEMVREVILQYT
jgi:hypothetical protein